LLSITPQFTVPSATTPALKAFHLAMANLEPSERGFVLNCMAGLRNRRAIRAAAAVDPREAASQARMAEAFNAALSAVAAVNDNELAINDVQEMMSPVRVLGVTLEGEDLS
jgi:hypothetical protein